MCAAWAGVKYLKVFGDFREGRPLPARIRCGAGFPDHDLAGLDAVAHRTETRECLGPIVARRTADDAQRTLAAEPQPLHDRHRRTVLAADGIDPGFVAGLAVDADWLGHCDLAVAHTGNRRGDLLGKTSAVVGRCRRRSDDADDHEGRYFKAGLFIAVG